MCSVQCDHHVIAPGGSVVCRENAIAHLKAMGPVIYLRVPLEELKRRIHNLDSRGHCPGARSDAGRYPHHPRPSL